MYVFAVCERRIHGVDTHAYALTWGRQSRALAVFLWCSLPYAMRQGISLNQQNSLFWLRLAGQQAPRLGLSAPTKAGVPGAHGHAQLFIWC